MKIYLVIDIEHAPGRINACMLHKEDAEEFARLLQREGSAQCVEERTLFYGPPPHRGYNK